MAKTPATTLRENPFSKYQKQLLVVLVLVLVIAGLYFYNKNIKTSSSNPTQAADETKTLVSQVGKLMLLPNETPQIATVSDISKLANEPFFSGAQNGDKVLIFAQAQKAVLYRPSINKIINVGPVNLASSPTPSVTTEVSPTPTLEVSPTEAPTDTPTNTPEVTE